MNQSMVRPYFYQAVQYSYFLNLNEQQNLTLSRGSIKGIWGQEEILQHNCCRFVAAPDANDDLHIIAADYDNKLCHLVVTEDQVQTKPFIIHENGNPFLLAFSINGTGYFFYVDDHSAGKLKAVKYAPLSGWSEELSPEYSYSVPVSLAIDNCGSIHLLLHDLTNGSLNYHFRSQTTQRWADPFCLDSAVQLSLLPAMWITAGKNIHIAWFMPRKNTVCYRMKKAGGWPVGGWQPEQYLPVQTVPGLLSFREEAEHLKIWCIGTENIVEVFYLQNGSWQHVSGESSDCLPIRHGVLGGELYTLAGALPPTELFLTKVPSETTGEEGEYRQCQNEIKALKDQLEQVQGELTAKETAIDDYRRETDVLRSWLTKSKQQEETLLVTLRKAEQEYRQCQSDNKLLREQLKHVQKKLSVQQVAVENQRMEADTLRLELTKSRQQEEVLRQAIRKMNKEMAGRKGFLAKILSSFQRKG